MADACEEEEWWAWRWRGRGWLWTSWTSGSWCGVKALMMKMIYRTSFFSFFLVLILFSCCFSFAYPRNYQPRYNTRLHHQFSLLSSFSYFFTCLLTSFNCQRLFSCSRFFVTMPDSMHSALVVYCFWNFALFFLVFISIYSIPASSSSSPCTTSFFSLLVAQ